LPILASGQTAAAILLVVVVCTMVLLLVRSSRSALLPMQQLSQHKESLRSELIQALAGLPEVIAYEIRPRLLKHWHSELTTLSKLEHQQVKRQAISGAFIQGRDRKSTRLNSSHVS